MAEVSLQIDALKAPATAPWHPLSPSESALEETPDHGSAAGYFGLLPNSSNSQADSSESVSRQALSQNETEPAESVQATENVPDFIVMLPQAPHKMSYDALYKNFASLAAPTNSKEADSPNNETLPAHVVLPVIATLTKQLEEAELAVKKSEAVRHSQIDSLKALIEPSITPQVIERTLIRARAAATDAIPSEPQSPPHHDRPYSSRPWELHVGRQPQLAPTEPVDATAMGGTDNKSIDAALDEAMSESHMDLGFTPTLAHKKDKQINHSTGRKRQTSLSARIFGGLVSGHASTPHNERERHSSKESTLSSNAIADSDATMSSNGSRPSSPANDAAPLPHHQHHHQKRSSYLSDWTSVLTWRSGTRNQRSASPESLDRSRRSVQPEEPQSSQDSSNTSVMAAASDTTPTESNMSQTATESQRPQSPSSQSSQSTTLGSTHPSLENRPTIESVMAQPMPSPAQDSFDETQNSPVDKSASPAPGTPSSAVRALISKKQIEPPALSLPTNRVTSASASEASIPPPSQSKESKQDTSPAIAMAPNAEDLPHEAGPIITEEMSEEPNNVSEEPSNEPETAEHQHDPQERLASLPSPVLAKIPQSSPMSRSQSYSSQMSRSSSNKDLPRSGSGYVSNMLNKTMAFVAHPTSRSSPKRAMSYPGDSRIEPAVTLPSLGLTKQGPVFQLAPASNASNFQNHPSSLSASASNAAPPPPASMELTTLVSSEARPPSFGASGSQKTLQGINDLVDRYGFVHEQNGKSTLRELRQRQQDASSARKSGNLSTTEETESSSENSVKRLLARLDEMDEADERRLRANWDAFLKRRRAQLAPNEPSTARKERANSLAQSVRSGGGAASLNSGFVEGEEDVWTENLIGVARLGTSGKEGKEIWREFKKLVRQGIPVRDRPAIWAELSGANDQREPGYYQELLANHEEGHDSLCLKQIEADVGRTFGTNVFFGGDGPGVAKLRRVLMAYSWHNPEVGYCQGMNLIAGSLLLALPTEEDAFWVLLCIIERILPSEYFTSTLLVSRADQRVMKDLVAKHLPKIHEHMEDLGIELEALSFGWFLSLFSMALPIRTLLRVLDVFFVDGAIVLFRITAAMLQTYADEILACDNASDLYVFMRTMPSSIHQADRLIALACGEEFRGIKTKDVVALRERHVAEMTSSMNPPKQGRK